MAGGFGSLVKKRCACGGDRWRCAEEMAGKIGTGGEKRCARAEEIDGPGGNSVGAEGIDAQAELEGREKRRH